MVSLLREILRVTRSQEDQSIQATAKPSDNSHSSSDSVGPIFLARNAELREAKHLTPGSVASPGWSWDVSVGRPHSESILLSLLHARCCYERGDLQERISENPRVLALEAFIVPPQKKLVCSNDEQTKRCLG